MIVLAAAALLMQARTPPPLPKDPSTLVKVADKARLPSLAADADGAFYVAFARNGNIEVAISTDGGMTFSAPVTALDGHGKQFPIPHRCPRIAVDKQKRIYVSAPICPNPDASTVTDLYLAVSTDRGKSFKSPAMINEASKSAPDAVHATAAGPGELHVAWLDTRGGKPALCYAKFNESGKRAGKTLTLAPYACERCPPAIAVDGRGNPVIAYREGREPAAKTSRQIFLLISSDGGRSFGPAAQLNSVDSGLEECPQDPPAVAFAADGKLVAAAWMDRRDLERDANVYWTFGPPGKLGRDTDVHDDRRYVQRHPALAVDADSTLWCAWEDGRLSTQRVFYTNTKDPRNIPLGDAKDGPGGAPSLASGGGKVAVAYECADGVGFRVLLATK